jgi:hypothetical protein
MQLHSMIMGLVAAVMLGACGGYIVAHHRAWNAATAHYSAVVNSCLSANATNAATINQLQAANDQWANAAKADAAKVAQAVKDADAAKTANAKALATAQAKLKQVIHDKGDAHAWGVTTVPAGVIDALGVRHADGSH